MPQLASYSFFFVFFTMISLILVISFIFVSTWFYLYESKKIIITKNSLSSLNSSELNLFL